jgi:hypothetical protein
MASPDTLVTPFGLGYAMQAANLGPGYDLDNFTRVQDLGWWSFNAGNVPANAPAGAPATGQGFLYVTRLSTTSESERVLQMWFSVQYPDRIHVRNRGSDGVWKDWQKMMTATSPGVAAAQGHINSLGGITRGSGIASVEKTAVGTCHLTFTTTATTYLPLAQVAHPTIIGFAQVDRTANYLEVRTYNLSGALADMPFFVAIYFT